jgi:glycosyltransferase involved in cell wall biosynthesis
MLRLRIGRGASAIATNSEAGLNYWRTNGYEGRLVVIRNGVSNTAITPVDQSGSGADLVVPMSERIILFAGRLSAEKNLERLIPALDKVLTECPGYTAILCGEGPQHKRIEKWIEKARMGNKMRLLGFRPDLKRWMERAAVFVSVSLFEGNPNTVLEAMVAGCPLLVSDIPEHREILDESCALFCSPYSSDDIAAGLERALGDNNHVFARARVARERATAFTIEAASAAYIDLYEAVLSDSGRKTG